METLLCTSNLHKNQKMEAAVSKDGSENNETFTSILSTAHANLQMTLVDLDEALQNFRALTQENNDEAKSVAA